MHISVYIHSEVYYLLQLGVRGLCVCAQDGHDASQLPKLAALCRLNGLM